MNSFRRFSRRAWLLHGYLIAMLVLLPVPMVRSGWIDTDSDAVNDSWEDTVNGTSLSVASLDATSIDIDNDGAYNSEELAHGSDPFDLDSDNDGLTDGDEIHLAIQGSGKAYSLTAWDSNGDDVSDHDDFYGCFSVTYPGGQLPAFSGASYADYDGDGVKNPLDAYPADPLNNDADMDGIDDGSDPALGDSTNTSTINGQAWGGDALGDGDNDAILNFWDQWPGDSSNGSGDSDADGIDNSTDPFPGVYSNYSGANGIYWYGDVLGDADLDWVPNYADQWPYDASNGVPAPSNDNDGDGLMNDLDPAPGDSNNHSGVNGYDWYSYPLEDADNDGTNNFNDPWPYDTYDNLPDFDGDGWLNADDPFPKDGGNYSILNQTAWGATLFDDADSDQIANWQDEFPQDTFNNNPDFDGDGIVNGEDPYPKDINNVSAVNGIAWLGTVNGDDDQDGTPNWNDTTPYTVDSDGDSIDDPIDPYVNDASNTSSVNGIAWGANVLNDNDGDGTPNWNDATPYPDTDADDDGIDDADDPYDNDATNTSPVNNIAWGANVLLDQDIDGIPNWNDPDPIDSDGDGWSDGVDPFDNDINNYSGINNSYWYGDVLGNADGDALLNWEDAWPGDPYNGNSNPDRDGDGYANEQDPAPDDFSNYSSYNWQYWYGGALGDNDNDGTANFYDSDPNQTYNNTVDADWDGILDSNDPAPNDASNFSYVNGQWWYGSALNDDDGDGTLNFYDDTPSGPPLVDGDGDGLYSDAEAYYGTSDGDVDSDDDSLSDAEEVNIFGTDPANAHHLSQQQFSNNLYTDWQLVDLTDTDDDDIPDRIEQHYGLNPSWKGDALLDRDNDGVNNLAQYNAGLALDANLSTYDADSDGMTDVFEDAYAQVLSKSNPADAVLDADDDGVLNHEEQILLISPQNADTLQQGGLGDLQVLMLSVRYPDGSNPPDTDVSPANGIPDWADAIKETPTAPDHYHFTRQLPGDLDGDGMPDEWEHEYGRWKFATNGLQLRFEDAAEDADDDGLSNLFEYLIGTSPLAGDSDGNNVTDDNEDFDGDGLTNAQEMTLGTSALTRDTDGDGVSDGQEVMEGTDALNAASNAAALTGLRVFTPVSTL
jgi:hypothetical protein